MTALLPAGSRASWFPGATIGLAALAGLLVAVDVRAAGAVVGLVVLVLLVQLPAVLSVAIALLAYLLPLTQLSALTGDTRAVAPVVALVALVKAVSSRGLRLDAVSVGTLSLGVTALASIGWSEQPDESLLAGVALVVSALLLVLAGTLLTREQLRQLLVRGSVLVIMSSAALALLPLGHLGERTRGVFANPNSLSLFVVLVLPLLVTERRTRPVAVVALVLVLLSGSRAGALGCALELAVLFLAAHRARVGRGLLVALLLGAAALGAQNMHDTLSSAPMAPAGAAAALPEVVQMSGGDSMLRTTDSRSLQWYLAWETWSQSPLEGRGAGAASVDAANSYLKLLADLGLLGLVAAGPLLVHLRRVYWRGDAAGAALVAGASVNAFFESWMLTAGSFFFLLFWVQLVHREGTCTSS